MPYDYYCRAQNLTIGYGGKPLLQNIELGVQRGEILALIGPNGAGKSTLLKSLAGQLALQGGTVLLDGKSLITLSGPQRARRMALMLPHTRRTELTTCFDLVSMGRIPYTGRLGILSAEDKKQVWDALDTVGARELAGQDFNCISDGQRQRILLARAICQQPELILLDEPTSFLDIRGKVELLDILRRLAREKHLAVLVTLHELDLAQKAADRVACVSPGGVSHAGRPEKVFTSQNIRSLYRLTQGDYDPLFGSVELARPAGVPETFVIGGGGQGVPVYRRLQREGIPFIAGILFDNDLDLPVAQALAGQVIAAPAFSPVPDIVFEQAAQQLGRCLRVLCVPQSEGPYNEANRRLRELARHQGKLAEKDAL
ncbi:MAG: ABC transporter ATP-binding protein [Faecalibacterium sp.]